ncbi:small GTP-binding protein [Thermocrinis albus DSM 14484]|uniref:Small GTP-binding protein n=1 Tax=Thermocrinis albus (strain DSM 14484 / JCM 11386 / HI 11/12) TaxID=638303 RepID=D3SPN3_THEAH|nr:ATP/GTP-binding protein [Thermocrinis albus]ADC89120.1 small GTP-binding protein [Thermocrinis albus DSM 14484]
MRLIKKIKVVVAGPFAAGKTQFINTVSEIKTVQTERRTRASSERSVKEYTTVAMDFGKIRIDDEHELYLFGTPGQSRFDFMWEILAEGALGIIILVDSTDPSTFHEARRIINFFQSRFPVPMVVGANKQDLPNAWPPEDIRIALDIDESENIPVIPLSAKDKESVKNVLLTLLYLIKKQMEV